MAKVGRWRSWCVSRVPVIGLAPAYSSMRRWPASAESHDPILWRALCLDLSPELVAFAGGLERLATVRRAGAALAPSEDAPWRQALVRQTALEHWLRGRLADVIVLGHDAEGKLLEPTEGRHRAV